MEKKKIDKERLGAKVLFPRLQYKGISCEDKEQTPARQDFTIETKSGVPGMGDVRLIVQTAAPRMTFQLFEPKDTAEFDSWLGTLLGMHDLPTYIDGRTDFMVLFQGSRDGQEVTQQNHREVYRRICHAQEQAARWWHLYGNVSK